MTLTASSCQKGMTLAALVLGIGPLASLAKNTNGTLKTTKKRRGSPP